MPIILKLLIGTVIGAAIGFIYYKIIGCPTGACPLTKTPLRSMIYWGLLGLLVAATSSSSGASGADAQPEVEQISAVQAKEMMDSDKNIILLDVRTTEEFEEGHMKGAILIPDYDIKTEAENKLIDKNAAILVYCRSGRRSALAAQALHDLGYSAVYDFGGIIDWPYENYIIS